MAVLYMGGAEIHSAAVGGATGFPEGGVIGIGSFTWDNVVFRSGARSWKYDSGAGPSDCYTSIGVTLSVGATHFLRAYVRIATSPGADVNVLGLGSSITTGIFAVVKTDGTVQLFANSALRGSPSSISIADSQWHRLELMGIKSLGGNWTDCELRLDGVTVGTFSGSWAAGNEIHFGINTPPVGAENFVINVDDVICNDSSGLAGTYSDWAGSGKLVLMVPSSDSQRGSWTGGAGGTTNLWDAVDNKPPIGTAAETDSTQIESTDSSGDNATDEYRGNCGTYTAAGIAPGDTIRAIQVWCNHGEDVSTNTKSGVAFLQANPAIGPLSGFNFGDDGGALGTWPTNWKFKADSMTENPTVTKDSSLILGLRKTDTGTRVASCDFLGAYVSFVPAEVVAADPPPIRPIVFPIHKLAPMFLRPTVFPESATLAIAVPDSDTGAGTDNATMVAAIPASDSGAGADTGTLVAAIPASDTGSGNDASSLAALLSDSDTGTGSDNGFVVVPVSGSDTGAGTDNATLVAAIPDSESGAGTDASSLAAVESGTDSGAGTDDAKIGVAGTESGAGSDTGALAASLPDADSGVGTDSTSLTAGIPGSETGGGTDASSLVAAIPGTDSGTSTENGFVSVPVSGSDTGAGTDNAVLTAAIPDTDSGAGTDASTLVAVVADTDTGVGTDVSTVSIPGTGVDAGIPQPLIFPLQQLQRFREAYQVTGVTNFDQLVFGTDLGTGTDNASLVAGIPAAEIGSGNDTASLVAGIPASDTGTAAENVALSAVIGGSEAGAGVDTGAAQNNVVGVDSGVGTDTAVAPRVLIFATEAVNVVEAAAIAAILSGSDTGVGGDTGVVVTAVLTLPTATIKRNKVGASVSRQQTLGTISHGGATGTVKRRGTADTIVREDQEGDIERL